MTESRRYPLGNQLDIQQILIEAQHRWLRPAEICEILSNHKRFHIAPESPHMPPNGSLFLFDRKVLRYFRKDGHNWRKKKDGKTVKEAHERLKSGSIDVLHCYYAHGEENENFQRRSYWMLEEELSHIVLVHYREVKGNRTNFNSRKNYDDATRVPQQIEDSSVYSEMDTSVSSNSHVPARTTDTISMNSAQASEYEDVESVYSNQASSRYHSFPEVQQPLRENSDVNSNNQGKLSTVSTSDPVSVPAGDTNGATLPCQTEKHFNLPSWEDFLGNYTHGTESAPPQSSFSSKAETIGIIPKQEEILRQLSTGDFGERQDLGSYFPVQNEWKESDHDMTLEGKSIYSSSMKKHLLDGSVSEEGLKKLDSFNRWMSKELGDVSESHVQSSSGAYWDTVEDETVSSRVHLDTYVLGPSLSQDQLFSIIDFSPNWAYVDSYIKVLITGRFLKSQEETKNCKWSCMFGEVEVPAEVIAEGVLRCQAPLNKAGVIPFYVSCSDRVACSEVREFEYRPRPSHIQDVDIPDISSSTSSDLYIRFGQLLSSSSASIPKHSTRNTDEICQLSDRISSFLKDDIDKMDEMLNFASEDGASLENVKEELLQKLLKDRLHVWLLQKAAEGGKGPSVLDEGGQGVLHFAAALGYDWALEPTIIAGVSINFRDVNGWTALHWAASCGRLRTVANLILLGAAPGLVTDPSPTYPTGRTPADIASANGHKGIAGYLAESALSAQLSSLDLEKKDSIPAESSGPKPEVCTSNNSDGHLPHELSLKDSLAAVCNATQAAARIHQVFRVQSFQKKQLKEFGGGDNNKLGMSDERVLSLIALKANKPDEPVHSAAVRIQNKFRSWKGRKEFLIIRQRIVKIQAHVRGHQVRKNYRKIIWSVGIVEKVILRWRRKRSGLRGFKSEAISESSGKQDVVSKEDDYDFLKEGRKQTEARSRVALARVKSMHQYPEARDQYSRLLSVVTEIQETKVVYESMNNLKSAGGGFDDLIDIEELLDDDDTFMPSS